MSRTRDYVVVRVHDDRYRLDRMTPAAAGPVAFVNRVRDRQGGPLDWRLRLLVVMQGSRSKMRLSAANALASTKLLSVGEARTLTADNGSPAMAPRRAAL